MKSIIITVIYFLFPASLALAYKVGGNTKPSTDAGWIGPIIAILIIAVAIIIAKRLKKKIEKVVD